MKVIPLDHFESFTVHHLPDKVWQLWQGNRVANWQHFVQPLQSVVEALHNKPVVEPVRKLLQLRKFNESLHFSTRQLVNGGAMFVATMAGKPGEKSAMATGLRKNDAIVSIGQGDEKIDLTTPSISLRKVAKILKQQPETFQVEIERFQLESE